MTAPTCTTCKGTGILRAGDESAPCLFCPEGVALRKRANLQAINAYRISGSEPVVEPFTWGTLQQRTDAIRDHAPHDVAQHACRSCDKPLPSGSPCGARCARCHEEIVALSKARPPTALSQFSHWELRGIGALIGLILIVSGLLLFSLFKGTP